MLVSIKQKHFSSPFAFVVTIITVHEKETEMPILHDGTCSGMRQRWSWSKCRPRDSFKDDTKQQCCTRSSCIFLVNPFFFFFWQIKASSCETITAQECRISYEIMCNPKTYTCTHVAQWRSENVHLLFAQTIFQMMKDLKFLIFSLPLMKDFHFLNPPGKQSHSNSSRAL